MCIHICVHALRYISLYEYARVHTCMQRIHIYIAYMDHAFTYINTCIYVHTYMYVHIRVCVCVCVSVCVCVCVCVCNIGVCVCTYIHTHTYCVRVIVSPTLCIQIVCE